MQYRNVYNCAAPLLDDIWKSFHKKYSKYFYVIPYDVSGHLFCIPEAAKAIKHPFAWILERYLIVQHYDRYLNLDEAKSLDCMRQVFLAKLFENVQSVDLHDKVLKIRRSVALAREREVL